MLAVGQGLVKFKPGSTEWENDAAAEIKQVDDKTIEFTLKDGLKFSGDYGDAHRRGCEILLRALHSSPDQTARRSTMPTIGPRWIRSR